MTESTDTPATSGGATSEAAEAAEAGVLTLTPDQLDQLAAKLVELLPSYLIYRDPPVVPVWEVPAPPPAPGAVEYAVAFGTDLAAGDPGPAAELPASTGRSAAEGIPDTVIEPDPEPFPGRLPSRIRALTRGPPYERGRLSGHRRGACGGRIPRGPRQERAVEQRPAVQPRRPRSGVVARPAVVPGVQSWVFRQAGAAGPAPVTVSCAAGVAWFRSRGRFSEYPAVGAQVFFGPGGGSHVGLVYAYDAAYAYTVEGNTNATGSAEGDGVHLKKRLRRDAYVYGYGHPAYPGGIVSAAPGAVPAPPPFPGAGAFRLNASHPAVVDLDRRLIAKGRARHHDGNGYQPGPVFTEYTRRNVRDFQLAQGWSGADADGYPGPETWRRLWT